MNIIDRYIIKNITLTLFFAIIALCVIFLVVSLIENLDEFLDRDVETEIIVKYYLYYFPEIIKFLTPVAMLISTLFSIGRLSMSNEITAVKTGGMSLYRIMASLTVLALILSFVQLYFNGWIVPRANEKKFEIEREYLKMGKSGGPIYNLYFRDDPLRNVIIQHFNERSKTSLRIAVENYSSVVEPRMTSRIEARSAVWKENEKTWRFFGGIKREYADGKIITETFDSTDVKLNITPEEIVELKRLPEEMTFDELKRNIELLDRGGKDVRRQMIEYHGNYAFPFANFIVILFGVPFASVRKKGGLAIQIAAAMVISLFYLVFTKVGQTLGYAYDINPVISGWMANIIFFALGIFTIFKTKT